jgi:hypothetical protein
VGEGRLVAKSVRVVACRDKEGGGGVDADAKRCDELGRGLGHEWLQEGVIGFDLVLEVDGPTGEAALRPATRRRVGIGWAPGRYAIRPGRQVRPAATVVVPSLVEPEQDLIDTRNDEIQSPAETKESG